MQVFYQSDSQAREKKSLLLNVNPFPKIVNFSKKRGGIKEQLDGKVKKDGRVGVLKNKRKGECQGERTERRKKLEYQRI